MDPELRKTAGSMAGVRLSFMASDMKRLAMMSEDARGAFADLRNQYEVAIENGDAGRQEVRDWVELNEVVDEQDRTIEWFDKVRDDPEAQVFFALSSMKLFELLHERGRWADSARVFEDPARKLQQRIDFYAMANSRLPAEQAEAARDARQRMMRTFAGNLYAACLAARRDGEAEQIVAMVETTEDAHAILVAMASNALTAGQPRPEHIEWLADSSLDVNELRSRIEDALQTASVSPP